MPASFSLAQIERFKREAKQRHRAFAISHSQALDRVAVENGYSNWSLLIKHSGGKSLLRAKSAPPVRFTRTAAEMRLRALKVPEPRGWGIPSRIETAIQQVDDFSHAFVSPQNAVAFAIEYVSCLLTLPRFKIYSAAPVYWEMRSWLPYGVQGIADDLYIIVNRRYKPVGQVKTDWAKYEDFPHLHVRLGDAERRRFAHSNRSNSFLFNDGCPPWDSRADAVAYLDRLRQFSEVLRVSGRPSGSRHLQT